MAEPWQDKSDEARWSDREAWRGDLHRDDPNAWVPDSGDGWVWADGEPLEEAGAEDWPEDLAGPEYWMFRREADE